MGSVLVTVLLVCFVCAVAGCGGGSDYNKVSGVAAKGMIRNGTVKVYKIDEGGVRGKLLATTMTDEYGYYSASVLSEANYYVEVTGGSYIDEATGDETERGASDVLRAVVSNYVGRELTIAVTDLTEIAVRIALEMEGGLSSANIEASNTNVSKILGVDAWGNPVMDITKVNPVDIFDSDAFGEGDDDQKRYAKMLAVISQAIQNDTEKESGEILDDLAAYLGGNAPAGSVSMETTLAQAAADFFNAANENNVTGETEFNELHDAVIGARYSSPERVTGISVFQPKEEVKGSALETTSDGPLGKAIFSYDEKNNLSNISIEVPGSGINIIGDLTYDESGSLASVKVAEKETAKVEDDSLFELINNYGVGGLLDNAFIKNGLPKPLTVKFVEGNLYHIASCMLEGDEVGGLGLTTDIDDAGLLHSMTLEGDVDATIRRLENGRMDRVLVKELSDPKDRFWGGNWFYYDEVGNLKTVISLYDMNPVEIDRVDELVATLYEEKGKDISELNGLLNGYTLGEIQYTEYNYRPGKNGGHDIAQIDARLISINDSRLMEDGNYSVLFTDLTEAGNAQKIELYKKASDDLLKASSDQLMGYATLTYEKGQMKRSIWGNAVKEAIRVAYRNVYIVSDVGFF
ncbi:hypothetical protein DSLASN_25520 [Desulfoluna limicola]|uniref:Lipoprotein n=1 Tax=Desulfoluna limicola TaxID=2810562 RepID=A0ABN6F6Q6_9BACT|nr:hypothetical protein DSLASN_25520 [Desulfoluna limicola]